VKICYLSLVSIMLGSSTAAAKCLAMEEAAKRVGDQACVTGKVVKVAESKGGTFFLNFCEKYRECPFTVLVFPSDLKNVGDVRQLEGKTIEVFGRIQSWRGHGEIVLRDARQLKGEAAKIPPVPKEYDAERKGKFSPKAPASTNKKSPQQ
jgi:hypothetical protein